MATITVTADGLNNPEGGRVEGFAICSGTLVPGDAVVAGGEAVTFADFTDSGDGSAILALQFGASSLGTLQAVYLPATGKVKYFEIDDAPIEAIGDLDAHTFTWIAILAV